MDLSTMFGKLHEHKIELDWLVENEEGNKKKKGLALKVIEVKDKRS